MKLILRLLILVPLLGAPAARAYAVPASPGADAVKCAAEEMQVFYYYLNAVMDPALKQRKSSCGGTLTMPDWLEKIKPAMLEKKVWKDPEEGDLSEAVLWQTPVSILYEFASNTQKTLQPEDGGAGALPAKLEARYDDMRLRFIMSVDRIERAKLEGSFEGRGKGMLSTMNMIMQRMDGVTDALETGDKEGYGKEAAATLTLSRDLFAQLFEASRGGEVSKYTPKARLVPGYRGVSLPVPGHQTLFLKSGDRVDMLVTFDASMASGVKETVTATMLQNVLVIRVTKPEAPGDSGVVQLLCNPNEAQYAALSLAQGKTINFIRRAPGDFAMRPMEIASFRKLVK